MTEKNLAVYQFETLPINGDVLAICRIVANRKKSGRNLVELINEGLDLSKIDVHKIELETANFDLKAEIAERESKHRKTYADNSGWQQHQASSG